MNAMRLAAPTKALLRSESDLRSRGELEPDDPFGTAPSFTCASGVGAMERFRLMHPGAGPEASYSRLSSLAPV